MAQQQLQVQKWEDERRRAAEQLAQSQLSVEMWQKESMRATDEMQQFADRLEDALQREQGLRDSMSDMQCQSRHDHIIPVTPLVSQLALAACANSECLPSLTPAVIAACTLHASARMLLCSSIAA